MKEYVLKNEKLEVHLLMWGGYYKTDSLRNRNKYYRWP